MPLTDKNATTISAGDFIKYPIDSGETEFHYGRILEVVTHNGTKTLRIEPIRELSQCAPNKVEVITKFNTTITETNITDIATDYADIVQALI